MPPHNPFSVEQGLTLCHTERRQTPPSEAARPQASQLAQEGHPPALPDSQSSAGATKAHTTEFL